MISQEATLEMALAAAELFYATANACEVRRFAGRTALKNRSCVPHEDAISDLPSVPNPSYIQPTTPLISRKSWMAQSAYSRPLPDCL